MALDTDMDTSNDPSGFDVDNYRQRLDQALGLNTYGSSSSMGDSGVVDGGQSAAPQSQIQLASNTPRYGIQPQPKPLPPQPSYLPQDSGNGQSQIDPGPPVSSLPSAQSQAPAQPGQPTQPGQQGPVNGKAQLGPQGFSAKDFDTDKLKDVKTSGDLVAAMKPDARNQYMDWWEQQYGAINDKFNAMRDQLGGQKDQHPNMTRQQKFETLLDFGLHLMRASQPDRHGGPGGGDFVGAVGEAVQGSLGDRVQQDQSQEGLRQQKLSQIEQQRQAELKGVGNYGDAVKGANQISRDQASIAASNARAASYNKPGKESLIYGKGNTIYGYSGGGKASQITDQDGKPIETDPTRAPGRGGGRDSVFSQKLSEWRNSNPLSDNASAEEKQSWNEKALAFASGKTGLTNDTVFLKALGQAQRELGNPSFYDGETPYRDAVNARALEIYSSVSGRNPMGGDGRQPSQLPSAGPLSSGGNSDPLRIR